MGRRGLAILLAAFAAQLGPASANPICSVPPTLVTDDSPLPVVAQAAARGAPIRIVALGSGTTLGLGASSPAAAFPARLEATLRPQLASPVTVINQGVQRQSASDMVARLDKDVLVLKPTLVLWETGTVDAVRGVPLDEFSETLEAGVARIREAGADVLLIDPQYARHMPRLVNLLPFVEAMRTIAANQDLILFDRFEVMHHWVDNNIFHLDERAAPRVVGSEIDQVYDCIGRLLAGMILHAAPGAGPPQAHNK
jgi:hypothetical protein